MTSLDERYGRTPRDKRRGRLFGIGAAVAIAMTFVLWVLWAGVADGSRMIETRNIARETINQHETRITFEVSVHDEVAVNCAVQALNTVKNVVGWKILHVRTDLERTQIMSTVVNTSEAADNGMVYQCWIP